MSWFEKLMPSRVRSGGERKHSVPEGLWTKCDACDQVLYRPELERNCDVCPKCGHHMRISARRRLNWLLDDQSGEELAADMESADPLAFRDLKKYKDRLAAAQKSSREREALVVMAGTVRSIPVVAAAFEFTFMGGSMGSVVGQKFVLAVSKAIEQRCALVVFTASGPFGCGCGDRQAGRVARVYRFAHRGRFRYSGRCGGRRAGGSSGCGDRR